MMGEGWLGWRLCGVGLGIGGGIDDWDIVEAFHTSIRT
jgi:hypothetical protein